MTIRDELPHNQHFVPQHYLKGFADSCERTHLWVYNKGWPYSKGTKSNRRNPFRQAIRSAGARRDIYSLTTIDGRRVQDAYEKTIARQEEIGLPILRKLRARESLSLADKVAFSVYIDLMMDRVPAMAVNAAPFIRSAMKEYSWDLLRRKSAEEGLFSVARRFDPDLTESVEAVERQLLLEGIVQRSPTIVKQLASMTWQLFLAGGDRVFPTTDNPAFRPKQLGLGKENGFLVMPIDSRLALLISNVVTPDCSYTPATTKQFNLLVGVVLSGATAQAYACRSERSILRRLSGSKYR